MRETTVENFLFQKKVLHRNPSQRKQLHQCMHRRIVQENIMLFYSGQIGSDNDPIC